MKYFAIGLIIGLIGALLWTVTSVFIGIGQATENPPPTIINVFMAIGFIVMFAGPLTYWIILPVTRLIRRRKS